MKNKIIASAGIIVIVLIIGVIVVDKSYDNETNLESKSCEIVINGENRKLPCETVETLSVENYLRGNIRTIATNSPVLGGSWYVVKVSVNPVIDQGEVVYEDGHIQSKASFKYEFDPVSKSVIVKEFIVKG